MRGRLIVAAGLLVWLTVPAHADTAMGSGLGWVGGNVLGAAARRTDTSGGDGGGGGGRCRYERVRSAPVYDVDGTVRAGA